MQMDTRDDNVVVQNYSVSIKNIDENIDFTISISFAYDTGSLHKQCNSNFDKYFTKAISLGGEISKMTASISSYNASSEDCDLVQYPSVTNITNIESNI